MKFNILSAGEKTRRIFAKERVWHRWFAWRPVRADRETILWFEWVERKNAKMNIWEFDRFEYRPIRTKNIEDI
jgi:hypothetical protein